MTAFEDELGGIFEDVRRYSMGDARIEFCLQEALKRIRTEVDALAFEARELEAALVSSTTAAENARIRQHSHAQRVTWQERKHG